SDVCSSDLMEPKFYVKRSSEPHFMPGKRYSLPNLPYKYNALEPTISEKIMTLHHDKHHLAYVNGANAALDKLEKARQTGFAGIDVRGISRDLAFNASGNTMHSLFWQNMMLGGMWSTGTTWPPGSTRFESNPSNPQSFLCGMFLKRQLYSRLLDLGSIC